MEPLIGVAAIGASLLTAATIKVVDYFKSKKKNNTADIEKAKEEIINGIKEYDAAHPDEEGGNEDE
jgi:adenylate kinase